MKNKEILKHLEDILLEQIEFANINIMEADTLDFAKIAYNHGLKDVSNKTLEFIYKYKK